MSRRLLSSSAIYLAANICRAAIPFALLPVLTRYLSPNQYGQVAMFQTLVAGMAALTGVSVQGAANRKYYDNDAGSGTLASFIGTCLQLLLITSAITFAIAYPLRHAISSWLGLSSQWVLWAIFVSAATFVVNLRLGQWQVRGKARSYGAMQIGQTLVTMLVSLTLVVWFLRGAAGPVEAQILTAAPFAALALALLWRDRLLKLAWRPDQLKEALRFGVPLIPHVGGLFLLNAADRLVINDRLGVSQAGIYMVAVQLTMVLSIVFDAINKAYAPWLFERLAGNDRNGDRAIVRGTYVYFLGAFSTALLAFALGPLAVAWFAGPAFQPAGRLVGWLALGQAMNGMYLMVTNYIFYSRRTGGLSIATSVSAALNMALLILLVRSHGTQGAAWAFCAAMAFRFILTWWIANKRHPMPWLHFAFTHTASKKS